jgi:iron complex outermembrane receptor protein
VLEPAIDNSSIGYLMREVIHIGAEADFQGEPLPGWQVLASYTFIHSRLDNVLYPWTGTIPKGYELIGGMGNQLAGVPRHGASLWSTYRIGMLHGLKVGFGAVARSVREGDNANDYQLPAFVKCSAVAAYGWHAAGVHFNLQLNVDNLVDKHYYESLSGTRTVLPGAPRSWLATLTAEL